MGALSRALARVFVIVIITTALVGVVGVGVGVASPTTAYAGEEREDVANTVGASSSALPGIGRVAVAAPKQYPHAGVAADVGYGVIEGQNGESGSHQRAFGSLALMAQPLRFLAAALMLDGRYDKHPNDKLGSSSSAVGEPRLFVRGNEAVTKSLALGAQLGLWVPGGQAPSLRFDASTLDAILLATWMPTGMSDLALALNVGYRVDRSGESLSASDRQRIRPGDRLSLNLSDFDSFLLGVGASKRLGNDKSGTPEHIELFGDMTWDVLLGSKSPSALESPLRLGLGGRYHLHEDREYIGAMQIELRAEFGLSERPEAGPNNPLAPIDPRFAITLGFRWAPALVVKVKSDSQRDGANGNGVGNVGGATSPNAETVSGRVKSASGEPIAAAHVIVTSTQDASTSAAESGADGSFVVNDVHAGAAHVVAKAAGYDDAAVDVTVDHARPAVVDLVMKKSIRPGQLRGLVRSFNGKPLVATIRVEPEGSGGVRPPAIETKTDADGTFQIDLPPGSYEIVVAAQGFAGQRRPVQLEENGVTILNADLRPGSKEPPPP